MKNNITIFAVLVSLLFPLTAFSATKYPESVGYVNDFAKVLTVQNRQTLESKLAEFDATHKTSIVVAIVDSIYNYETVDTSIEVFGERLFNTWGVGNAAKNNGVLVILAVKDRKVRIQLGSGYATSYNEVMTKIIAEDMAPSLKSGKYFDGLSLGLDSIMTSIKAENPIVNNEDRKNDTILSYAILVTLLVLVFVFIAAAISAFLSGKTAWGWVFLSAAAAIILFLIKALFVSSKKGFGGGKSSGGGGSGSF